MITFHRAANLLILAYAPESGDSDWIYDRLEEEGVKLKRTFYFQQKHFYLPREDDDYSFEDTPEFILGKIVQLKLMNEATGEKFLEEYFKINSDILLIPFDLYIQVDTAIKAEYFTRDGISIFPCFKDLKPDAIYIGGKHSESIPLSEYKKMLKLFPTSYEVRKYRTARIASVIQNYSLIKTDAEAAFNSYLNKKLNGLNKQSTKRLDQLAQLEETKYSTILENLRNMLLDEKSYSEAQWQNEIIKIILLLFPKYISVFKEVRVRDSYNNKNKRLDYLLVDSDGNTDLIEIKKPFEKCILTKRKYRDNYIPLKELTGTVMQVEKYIFHLNKWGKQGEEYLTDTYKDKLPDKFKIKITNPSGIIIMGRSNNLSITERRDFEVIKRKYKNVIDIITYDDLISRVEFTLEQIKKN